MALRAFGAFLRQDSLLSFFSFLEKMSTTSLSKGVFSFRGKKKKPSPKDFVENECGLKSQQLNYYEYLCTELHTISQKIHADMAQDLFTELVSYVTICGQKRSEEEIHAAAIVTGVNTPDHSVLYSNLCSKLVEEVTPHVILIESKSNTTKLIMQSIASQLNSIYEDDENVVKMPQTHCAWSHITEWHRSLISTSSPKKVRKTTKTDTKRRTASSHPLVLLFEAFNNLPVSCLQDFILSCRNHLADMSIVLVFGVTLSLSSLRSRLTHEISTMLSIEAFQMKSSSVYLNQIIDRMLLNSDLPFRLGGKTFQLLLDNFLCHDFSIQKFLHCMQFCVMDHCLGNEHSVSCIARGKVLSNKNLDHIRKLTSFNKFVDDEADPKLQSRLLEDAAYTKSKILTLLEDINVYHRKQPYVTRCLHTLSKSIPKSAFGKQLREVYYSVLNGNFNAALEEDFKLFSVLSRNALQEQLTAILEIMSDCPVESDVSSLRNVLDKLSNFEELLEKSELNSAANKTSLVGKKMDMYTLRKTLQQQRPKHVTLFEEIRGEAVDALRSFFHNEVVHFKKLPLHELFYYDDIKTLKSAVNALPRVALFTALSKPHVYLHDVPKLESSQSVTSQLPDTSVAFKLHMECSTMINIYDWMQAFLSVHEGDDSKGEQHLKQLCSRFSHSAAEMQLLGLIKSTKRKTDHVTRLTWGTI
ncbi:ORC3 [Bugula neritina]|uniref:Origin recognition complex subunit 3 n=1 Tax=Bugula neritina TaxID=10212 RepID=A0A7J7JAP9_BUGNE|nr:ORC3 [Bugula neritina]